MEILHSPVADYSVDRSQLSVADQKRLQQAESVSTGYVPNDLLVELSNTYPTAVHLLPRGTLPDPHGPYGQPDEMKDVTDTLSNLLMNVAFALVEAEAEQRKTNTDVMIAEGEMMMGSAQKEQDLSMSAALKKKSAETTTATMKIAMGSVGVAGAGVAGIKIRRSGSHINEMKSNQKDINAHNRQRGRVAGEEKAEMDFDINQLNQKNQLLHTRSSQNTESARSINALTQAGQGVGTGSAESAAAEDNYLATVDEVKARFTSSEQQWHNTNMQYFSEAIHGANDILTNTLSGIKGVLDGSIETSRSIGRNV